MDSLNMDAGLSFNSSGHSTFALAAEKDNQIEQLKRKVRVLESDNSELLSTMPRLKDAQGKDCTGEMLKMGKELLAAKEQCEQWRTDYKETCKKYDNLEKSFILQLDQRDKQIKQLEIQAMEMEEENGRLREMLENEKSRVCHLQTDKRLAEICAKNEQFRSNISVGDKDVDACLKHLAIHDSISFSSKDIALNFETSTPEADCEQNLTLGSVLPANVTCRTSTLFEMCARMFEKLRGTAEFFQNLLKMLGVTAEQLGEDITKKLEAMKLDLDLSVGEAQSMLSEVGFPAMEESFAQVRAEKEQQVKDMTNDIDTLRKQQQELEEKHDTLLKQQQDLEEKHRHSEQLLAEERQNMLKVTAERDAFALELRDREMDVQRISTELQELQKQLEDLSHAKKTNTELKDRVVEHSRLELNKIFDTMQVTMSSCSSVVSSITKKKGKISKKQPMKDNQKQ